MAIFSERKFTKEDWVNLGAAIPATISFITTAVCFAFLVFFAFMISPLFPIVVAFVVLVCCALVFVRASFR